MKRASILGVSSNDHSAEHPVFNRSVGLRDSWAKMNK